MIEPYFETELGKLYCADSFEIMREMATYSIDLIVTDPPYGIGASTKSSLRIGTQHGKSLCASGLNYQPSDWDEKPVDKKYFYEMLRVARNQIVFGGNYYTNFLNNSSCWLIWDKDNGDNGYADIELAWTSFKTASRKIKWRWHGMLQEDMSKKETRQYPTQKPLPVIQWTINKYSKPGDIILDPFCGSGTTAVACEITKHKWIAIDKRKEACQIAKQRILKETRQLTIT